MSFRCEGCGKPKAGKPNRVIVKTRQHDHREVRRNEETGKVALVVVGKGPQIVQEANLCGSCLAE